MFWKFRVTLGLTLGLMASAAQAEDYTADQLKELFAKQKTAVEGLGQTRGLKIVTQDGESQTGAVVAADDVVASPVEGATMTSNNVPVQAVSMPEDSQINLRISFDYDSAALRPGEQAKLQPMCEAMQTSDVQVLRVVGHTDSSGSDDYNQQLSQLRAEEVARHLVNVCNIDPSRLQTMGLGERLPLNKENPQADENRRVEFQALS